MDELAKFIKELLEMAKDNKAVVIRIDHKKFGKVEIILDNIPEIPKRQSPEDQAEVDLFYSADR